LTKKYCSSEAEALSFFFAGEANRATASHILNKTSSRSHCIFTIFLESRASGDGAEKTTVSKLNLVDLAGSERTKKTAVTGQALKEATYINKSLTFLEQTVNALSRHEAHVPFRQSKLTGVLRDALGGNCKTVMIACVWPDDVHVEVGLSLPGVRLATWTLLAVINRYFDCKIT
jgi:kinesin family protein 6/9